MTKKLCSLLLMLLFAAVHGLQAAPAAPISDGVKSVGAIASRVQFNALARTTDTLVHRLSETGARIRHLFGGGPQDIEWAIRGGIVYIVQSRPYLESAGN